MSASSRFYEVTHGAGSAIKTAAKTTAHGLNKAIFKSAVAAFSRASGVKALEERGLQASTPTPLIPGVIQFVTSLGSEAALSVATGLPLMDFAPVGVAAGLVAAAAAYRVKVAYVIGTHETEQKKTPKLRLG